MKRGRDNMPEPLRAVACAAVNAMLLRGSWQRFWPR